MNRLFLRLFLPVLLGLFTSAFLVLPLVFGTLRLATLRDVHLNNPLSLIQLVRTLLRADAVILVEGLPAPSLDQNTPVIPHADLSLAVEASSLSALNSQPTTVLLKSNIYSRTAPLLLSVNTPLSHTSRQPPQLSPTVFALLTAGSLAVLSFFAVSLYCCARCRRRKKSQRREISTPGEIEKGKEATSSRHAESGSVSTGTMKRNVSPGALDFSPPSPTWKPAPPSLAYVTSNSIGFNNGLASGRGPILDAETIMQEREPGRRRVYGGGGWSYGPHAFAASATFAASTNPVPQHCRQDTMASQSTHGNPKAGTNIPMAPPLPTSAHQIYRPPASKRHSRLISIHPEPKYNGSVPKLTREQPSSNQSGIAASLERVIDVPRIEVHLAQDVSTVQRSESRSGTRTRQITRPAKHSASGNSMKTTANGSGLQRSRSTSSHGGRLASGLGITTLKLGGDNFTSLSPNSLASPTLSDEDVRLAYRTSTVSVIPTPDLLGDSEQRKRSVKGSSREVKDPGDKGKSTSKCKRISRFHPTRVGDQMIGAKFTKPSLKDVNSATPCLMRTAATNANSEPTSRNDLVSRSQPPLGGESRKEATLIEQSVSPSCSRSASAKRSNPSKRQALGLGTLDQRTKSELHDMRSLGSESFDNLIAYLEESVESEEADESREVISNGSRRRSSLVKCSIEKKSSKVKERYKRCSRVTREDTEHMDRDACEAWVGSLKATPSELRLTHVDVNSHSTQEGPTSMSPVRKRRTEIENAQSSSSRMNKGGTGEGSAARALVPLSERDMNVNSGRTRRRSQRVPEMGAQQNVMQEKVGVHVRDLRVRSASLKVKVQNARDVSTGTVLGTVPSSSDHAPLTVSKVKNVEVGSSKAQTRTELNQRKQTPGHHEESALLSAGSQAAISSLPSFSMPSTATQLYVAFPCSEASSSASLSQSSSIQPTATTRSLSHSNSASRQQFKSSKAPLIPAVSSRTICTSASASSSKVMTSAAYIARCAPTPRFKSSAVLSFLSPSLTSPSLPQYRHPKHSPGRQSHLSRRSVDSVSTLDSEGSAVSVWGRRSAWIRESLTPRFDQLMTLLEGRLEERPLTPSMPPVMAEGSGRITRR